MYKVLFGMIWQYHQQHPASKTAYQFSGSLFVDPSKNDFSYGNILMADATRFRMSQPITMTTDTLEFSIRHHKSDEHNDVHSTYRLKKAEDGMWTGKIEESDSMAGNVRCIITEVPDDFFLPT